MKIRPGSTADVDACMAIAACWQTLPRWTRDHFEQELDSKSYHFFVAEDGGRVVGFAGMMTVPPESEVTTVAVRPELARKGLGAKLMAQLQAHAKSLRCTLMALEVSEHNAGAKKLYDKLGYSVVGRRKKYYDDGSDALLMTLHL